MFDPNETNLNWMAGLIAKAQEFGYKVDQHDGIINGQENGTSYHSLSEEAVLQNQIDCLRPSLEPEPLLRFKEMWEDDTPHPIDENICPEEVIIGFSPEAVYITMALQGLFSYLYNAERFKPANLCEYPNCTNAMVLITSEMIHAQEIIQKVKLGIDKSVKCEIEVIELVEEKIHICPINLPLKVKERIYDMFSFDEIVLNLDDDISKISEVIYNPVKLSIIDIAAIVILKRLFINKGDLQTKASILLAIANKLGGNSKMINALSRRLIEEEEQAT